MCVAAFVRRESKASRRPSGDHRGLPVKLSRFVTFFCDWPSLPEIQISGNPDRSLRKASKPRLEEATSRSRIAEETTRMGFPPVAGTLQILASSREFTQTRRFRPAADLMSKASMPTSVRRLGFWGELSGCSQRLWFAPRETDEMIAVPSWIQAT